MLSEAVVGRQFDRSGGEVFDRCARFPCEVRTKEHGTGFGRRFEAEIRREFEKIAESRSKPAEIGEGLGEESGIVAALSDSDTDDFSFSADCEQVDRRSFGQETFGDHSKGRVEASEPMSDGAAQAGPFGLPFPFEFSQGSGSVRPH